MKTIEYTISEADAVRHLIVCDTQFAWAGVTNLTMPQMMDLQVRGWVVEGDDNGEFQLTEAGEEVVARALQHGVPKTLADVQPGGRVSLGDGPTIEKQAQELLAAEHRKCDRNTEADLVLAGDVTVLGQIALNAIIAALSAQPSPGKQAAHCPVKHCGMTYARVPADGRCHACGATVKPSPGGQGGARVQFEAWAKVGLERDSTGEYTSRITQVAWTAWKSALAARQPVYHDDEELQFYREHVGNDLDNMLMAAGVFEVHHEGGYAACWANSMEALKRLIDRQPVGEPVTVPGAPTSCRHCDSTDLKWFAHVRTLNDVQQGRLNTHDVGCVFVLGCEECSETLRVVKADDIAALLNAAPPVHARDLGQIWQQAFNDTAHSYRRNKSRMWVLKILKERVQALIDSQAVGK